MSAFVLEWPPRGVEAPMRLCTRVRTYEPVVSGNDHMDSGVNRLVVADPASFS